MKYNYKQALWSQMPYLSNFIVSNSASLGLSEEHIGYVDSNDLVFVDGVLKNMCLPDGVVVNRNNIQLSDFKGHLKVCHINTIDAAIELKFDLYDSDCVVTEFVFGSDLAQNYHADWCLSINSKVRHAQHIIGGSGPIILYSSVNQESESSYVGWRLSHSGSWLHEYTKCSLLGKQAMAEIKSLVLAFSGDNIQSAATFEHMVADTNSKHNVTMLVDSQARGVCFSDVFVGDMASGSVSEQYNRNIALSDSSEIYSQPRLCINNDQVECSHGVTTGKLESTMLLYMQSRGLSERDAEQLLINGYVLSAISEFPDDNWAMLAFDRLRSTWRVKC